MQNSSDPQEYGLQGIHRAWDDFQIRLVRAAYKAGISGLSERLSASYEGLQSLKFFSFSLLPQLVVLI